MGLFERFEAPIYFMLLLMVIWKNGYYASLSTIITIIRLPFLLRSVPLFENRPIWKIWDNAGADIKSMIWSTAIDITVDEKFKIWTYFNWKRGKFAQLWRNIKRIMAFLFPFESSF